MPYIQQTERQKYDLLIDKLGEILNTEIDNDSLSGKMNYVIFRLAKLMCSKKSGGKHNYARMATVLSALSEAQAEFRRRVMAPYEDEKIKENGDVEF